MDAFDPEPPSNVVLKQLGIDSIDGVKSARGEMLQGGRQEVVRIEAQIDNRPVSVFIKRMTKSPVPLHEMWPVLLFRRPMSRARREYENYQTLKRLGIGSAVALAYGEQFGWLKEKFSYIATAKVAGRPLDEFLDSCDLADRRLALAALGREIRRMHDLGICFPDLFARHIFVERVRNQFKFRLIDVARLICRKQSCQNDRARDLAALNVSVMMDHLGRTDRLRVLRAYGELDSNEFMKRIAARMRVLQCRKRFQPFFENRFARIGLDR